MRRRGAAPRAGEGGLRPEDVEEGSLSANLVGRCLRFQRLHSFFFSSGFSGWFSRLFPPWNSNFRIVSFPALTWLRSLGRRPGGASVGPAPPCTLRQATLAWSSRTRRSPLPRASPEPGCWLSGAVSVVEECCHLCSNSRCLSEARYVFFIQGLERFSSGGGQEGTLQTPVWCLAHIPDKEE